MLVEVESSAVYQATLIDTQVGSYVKTSPPLMAPCKTGHFFDRVAVLAFTEDAARTEVDSYNVKLSPLSRIVKHAMLAQAYTKKRPCPVRMHHQAMKAIDVPKLRFPFTSHPLLSSPFLDARLHRVSAVVPVLLNCRAFIRM